MEISQQMNQNGCLFSINTSGVVLEVMYDSITKGSLIVGQNILQNCTITTNQKKMENVIHTILKRQAVFNWDVQFDTSDDLSDVKISGIHNKDTIFLLATKTTYDAFKIIEEIFKILKHSSHECDSHLPHNNLEAISLTNQDMQLFDEISLLNNELVNLQRELTKKNIQLEQLNSTLELKVNQRTEKIQKLLIEKDEFIQNLGHDLKTPLGPLITILPVLKKSCSTSEHDDMFDTVIRNVFLIKNVVQKSLEIARLNSPNTHLFIKDIELKPIIEDVLSDYHDEIVNNHIRITNAIPPSLKVKADKKAIQTVFANLLSNAITFRRDPCDVSFSVKKSNSEVIICCEDNGIGLSSDQIDHVFDEFYKVDGSRHDLANTGLGLSLSKRIVQMHNGKIWVESEGLNQGSSFFVQIPLA